MRVNITNLAGKLLVAGELVGTALELQQALTRGETRFNFVEPVVKGDRPAAGKPAAVAPPEVTAGKR